MMHVQTYPIPKERVSYQNTDRTFINERYMDFLKFALYRIIETAILYETQAKVCGDSVNKLYLYYLAGKKRVQHVVLEMIAASNKGKPLSLSNHDFQFKPTADLVGSEQLSKASTERILEYAKKRAEKDLSLFQNLSILEEDVLTKKLLSTLSKLSKDFIHDIMTGYSKFTFQKPVSIKISAQ